MWGLVDRLEVLPGVTSTRSKTPDSSVNADFFLSESYVLDRHRESPLLFCHVDPDGVLIGEIHDAEREEILRKGWGTRTDSSLLLYTPRDNIELEVTWRILLLAYQSLATPAGLPRLREHNRQILVC